MDLTPVWNELRINSRRGLQLHVENAQQKGEPGKETGERKERNIVKQGWMSEAQKG